ncbi:conserved hypothetical protein (plasmid) [Gloeothece citriformis PCC 7424]|uniref:Uncharacterized protein n=1 Tax=Gloeothece citriformis (strain PCC 7424) TaxID=65393 RepID=B7KMI4_GLOC7|nr:hypothetical protein [Gloeothece citriformis]ACK74006.1 conserved hypothetical protein [Gloeothece citriformis PCC 7424]
MTKTKRQMHEKSLANLELGGRKPDYEEAKKRRNISLTDKGWDNLLVIAHKYHCRSVSELMEKIGRQEIKIEESD